MSRVQPSKSDSYDNNLTLSPRSASHLRQDNSNSGIDNNRIQKEEIGLQTDQVICKCQCDQINKLKQKAHKSFMQTIQIQNLYKEEIDQLREHYEERQKTQIKKFQCKESLLTEKCRQMEQQLEKNKQYIQKQKDQREICSKCRVSNRHILQKSLQSPFEVDSSIDNILPIGMSQSHFCNPDDSTDTIMNLQQFIPSENLGDQHEIMRQKLQDFIFQLKQKLLKSDLENKETLGLFDRFHQSLDELMNLFKILVQDNVRYQERYNKLFIFAKQLESRHNKLASIYEAAQKQAKFMTEHIRRISQQKIKIDKKYFEIEKTNRNLQQSIKQLKKAVKQRGGFQIEQYFNEHKKNKDQYQIYSSCNMKDDDDMSLSIGSIGQYTASNYPRKVSSPSVNPVLMRMNNNQPVTNSGTKGTNFKKKALNLLFQKKQDR